MTRIRAYNTATGHVETTHEWDSLNHEREVRRAKRVLKTLCDQDHQTDTVYYIDEG